MKKVILGVVIALMLLPSVSRGATTADLEAQHIRLLEQIIVLLQAQLQQLLVLRGLPPLQMVNPTTLTSVRTTSTSTPVVVKKKKSGGGGGGGGSRDTVNTPTIPTLRHILTTNIDYARDADNADTIVVAFPDIAGSIVVPDTLSLSIGATVDELSYLGIVFKEPISTLTYTIDNAFPSETILSFSGIFSGVIPSWVSVTNLNKVVLTIFKDSSTPSEVVDNLELFINSLTVNGIPVSSGVRSGTSITFTDDFALNIGDQIVADITLRFKTATTGPGDIGIKVENY